MQNQCFHGDSQGTPPCGDKGEVEDGGVGSVVREYPTTRASLTGRRWK
jgi:hypothetical protein